MYHVYVYIIYIYIYIYRERERERVGLRVRGTIMKPRHMFSSPQTWRVGIGGSAQAYNQYPGNGNSNLIISW